MGTGTSTGVPLIGSDHPVCKSSNPKDNRLRSSILLEWDELNLIVDTGPDFRQQMLNCNCKKIDVVLYTHEHYDHISGIDDLRAFCFRQGKIPVYAHKRVLKILNSKHKYIFDKKNRYQGAPELVINEIVENKTLKLFNHSSSLNSLNCYKVVLHENANGLHFCIDHLCPVNTTIMM